MAIFGDTAPMVIIGLLVSIADLIIHVIGFSTSYWYKLGKGHMGLWETCDDTGTIGIVCMSFSDIPDGGENLPDNFKAARVLECLALVAFIGAVICAVLKTFVLKDNGPIYLLCVVTNFIGGLFGIIGVILFATMKLGPIDLDASKFHFSFAFCIIASIGGFFTALVFFLAWRWVHLRT